MRYSKHYKIVSILWNRLYCISHNVYQETDSWPNNGWPKLSLCKNSTHSSIGTTNYHLQKLGLLKINSQFWCDHNLRVLVMYQLADGSVNRLFHEPILAQFSNIIGWGSVIRLRNNSERWTELKNVQCKFVQWYIRFIEWPANCTAPTRDIDGVS